MKKYKNNFTERKIYTQEMEDFFYKRTEKHISLVRKYCDRIHKLDSKWEDIAYLGITHDNSKYSTEEKIPYILISWYYYTKESDTPFILTKQQEEDTDQAVILHYERNPHHPEYHDSNLEFKIKNKKLIQATLMPDIYIAEMVADWCAMSEELKNGTPKQWADNNVGITWKFTYDQTSLIYYLIEKIWR